MASLLAYKVAILILVIGVVGASATAAYYYQQEGLPVSQAADLNSEISSLNSQLASKTAEVNSLNSQISSLNNQINTLNSQVSQLQALNSQLQRQNSQLTAQIQQLQTQVSQLQSQVAQLQSQLAQFQTANLIGRFTGENDCPFLSDCNYIANGAYANLGQNTAESSTVTFTFYSGTGGTGQTLCTVTRVLGNVPGQSIALMPEVICGGTTSTPSQSYTWLFDWD